MDTNIILRLFIGYCAGVAATVFAMVFVVSVSPIRFENPLLIMMCFPLLILCIRVWCSLWGRDDER